MIGVYLQVLVDSDAFLKQLKIEKIASKCFPFSLTIFQQDTLPVCEFDDIGVFKETLQLLNFLPKRKCIDEIAPIIEAYYNPTDFSFIAACKITDGIDKYIPFLANLLHYLLKLHLAINDHQFGQIGIGCDAIAGHDEVLVVLCEVVAESVD